MKEEHKIEEKVVEAVVAEETKTETCMEKCAPKMCTKTAIVIALVVILASLAYYYRSCFIAATVNGTPISRLEVMRQAEKQSGKEILDTLIVKQLIKDEAMKQKIRITRADVTAEVAKLNARAKEQGVTLAEALKGQGITMAELEENIVLQKQVEKMVGTTTPITIMDVNAYVTQNKIVIPKGQEETAFAEIKAKMEQDAFGQKAQALVARLKEASKVKYLVTY